MNSSKKTPARLDADLQDIPAVLLVGGMGTRLRSVLPSTPKPLARVGNLPFLQLLVLQLRSQGIRRIVMCTGHLAEQIEKEFGDGHKWDVVIDYSKELKPLGTAGAVKLAERYLQNASDFLVMNGDSFLELDFREFIRFHRERGGLISMAVRRVHDAARYGSVQLDANQRVLGFSEKTSDSVPGIVNGGVYVFNHSILKQIPEGPASLERDIFPQALERGVYALDQQGMFIDIGTPEDYARAQTLAENLYQAASLKSSLDKGSRCMSKAVFLDRDGVINQKPPESDYVTRWEDFHVLPGVAEGVALLNRAGFAVIVITNQRCIAKGLMTVVELENMHQRMTELLAGSGAIIDGTFYCPHEIEPVCECRKPAPGMLLKAARLHGIDLSASWMIGDSDIDIQAGRNAGCKTVRLMAREETPGKAHRASASTTDADITARSFLEAIRRIFERERVGIDSFSTTPAAI